MGAMVTGGDVPGRAATTGKAGRYGTLTCMTLAHEKSRTETAEEKQAVSQPTRPGIIMVMASSPVVRQPLSEPTEDHVLSLQYHADSHSVFIGFSSSANEPLIQYL